MVNTKFQTDKSKTMFVLHNIDTNEIFESETEIGFINKVQEISEKDSGEHPSYRVNSIMDALTYLNRYSNEKYKVYRKDEWDLYKLSHEDLIDRVIEQIKKDLSENDTTAIHGLLSPLKKEQLIDFLPESVW